MYYPAILEQEGNHFGVVFPHFPGCVAVGDTAVQALESAREALCFHVEGMRADGTNIPKAGDPELLTDLPEGAQVLVPLIETLATTERVNISIERGRLAAIDQEAKKRGVTRSAFMVSAAINQINR